jgi:hypothetical protein
VPAGFAREADAEDPGSVRAWVTTGPTTTTASGDLQPTLYGWERLLGDVGDPSAPVAVDNGAVRVRWLGGGPAEGLLLERFDVGAGRYVPSFRVLHRSGTAEVQAVEVTADRAVVSWKTGGYELRAELRRGWVGPRLESYAPTGSTARLSIVGPSAGRTGTSAMWDLITADTGSLVGAKSHAAVAWGPLATEPSLTETGGTWSAPRVLVVQTDLAAQDGHATAAARAAVRALNRFDVRATPTLVSA